MPGDPLGSVIVRVSAEGDGVLADPAGRQENVRGSARLLVRLGEPDAGVHLGRRAGLSSGTDHRSASLNPSWLRANPSAV